MWGRAVFQDRLSFICAARRIPQGPLQLPATARAHRAPQAWGCWRRQTERRWRPLRGSFLRLIPPDPRQREITLLPQPKSCLRRGLNWPGVCESPLLCGESPCRTSRTPAPPHPCTHHPAPLHTHAPAPCSFVLSRPCTPTLLHPTPLPEPVTPHLCSHTSLHAYTPVPSHPCTCHPKPCTHAPAIPSLCTLTPLHTHTPTPIIPEHSHPCTPHHTLLQPHTPELTCLHPSPPHPAPLHPNIPVGWHDAPPTSTPAERRSLTLHQWWPPSLF